MKKQYFLVVFTILFFYCISPSIAQLVGGYGFIQGAFLEIGQAPNGSLGSDCSGSGPAPAGYHPHSDCGTGLAMVYDYGHDGWTVGTPPYMGDYTLPGTPFEGWEVEVGGVVSQSYYDNFPDGTAFVGGTLTGANTSYTNSGGVISVGWAGTAGPAGALQIISQTTVDTLGSAVVFTVHLINTTAATLTGVYYLRSCDPDNTESWDPPEIPGDGEFYTDNTIVHQNEDATHRVLVTAVGTYDDPTTFAYDSLPYAYLALGTRDCRAKCFIYSDWGLASSVDLATVWNETYGTPGTAGPPTGTLVPPTANIDYALNTFFDGDHGIGLVYNIGNIAGFDSAVISFAYIFNGVGRWADSGLENPGVFPDPRLLVEDSLMPTAPIPNHVYDTFDVCGHPGDDTVIVDILYATTGNWTNSHWTWSPSTGLTSTTGTIDTIVSSVLPPSITYTITGSDSSGPGEMLNCQNRVFYLTILTCNLCVNNSPCQGDTLYLQRKGDSTGCTYYWYGPPGSGFTSTLQDPFIYPSTLADQGMFYVVRTLLGVHDTDSTYVTIHPLPVVTASSNSPLCTTPAGTLVLNATPASAGETFTWTGPDGFTSTLESPSITSFGPAATGIYTVVTTTPFGCTDSNTTDAELIPPPLPPIIGGDTFYCQGATFVPFTVTDAFGAPIDSATTIILWYPTGTGGTGSTTPPVIPTSTTGLYTVYASLKTGSCEGNRDSFKVRVRTTPPAPSVTGVTDYCDSVGPIAPLDVHLTATGVANWYTPPSAPPSGISSLSEPIPNINVVTSPPADVVYTYYVTQTDSSCQGPPQTVSITIHHKPLRPIVHPHPWCQLQYAGPVSATPSGTGDVLTWYGPGVTVGTSSAPTPPTLAAPDTIDYYVTETTSFNCISDSALDAEIIIHKPAPPVTKDVWYCQYALAQPLNAEVDSAAYSYLKWYFNGTLLVNPLTDTIPFTPVPPTDTTPGNTTWYVSQTVNTCESDSAMVTVTILYKPVFGIIASQPYVCQYDSITLKYNGPQLVAPSYAWTLPEGASFAGGTKVYDDSVLVNFDSAVVSNYVVLTVSDDSGKCTSDTSIRINIVTQPSAQAYTRPDVCLGDTVLLALNTKAADANTYQWYVDYIGLQNSQAVTIITANSNSGGPYSISWVDSGRHIIEVTSYTEEGCKSMPWYDTINVHTTPDAGFHITSKDAGDCIGDSVQFTADVADYNNSYEWSPANYFENINQPVAWGKVEEANTTITLTVTDPFGCVATSNMEIDPGSCCTVALPNAFTPNGDTHNDYYRPLYNGYHHFHVFRIVNRWGQVVFNSENSDMQWDGNCNGVPQDMGTYYYYLKYDCGGKTFEQKGDLTLIR